MSAEAHELELILMQLRKMLEKQKGLRARVALEEAINSLKKYGERLPGD